jgi:hypothetical protein
VEVLPALAQVDDRIAHQLTGAVISRLAPAIDRKKRMRQMPNAPQTRLVRRPADGVNRLMLQQEQFVA